MHLEVVTPRGTLLQADVDEVTAPGSGGEFGVLPGHVPLLTGLRPGVLSWSGAQQRGAVAVGKGFAQVIGDRVVVLVDDGVTAEAVDVQAAQKELAAAEKELAAAADDPGARTAVEERRDWAQARLALAGAGHGSAH